VIKQSAGSIWLPGIGGFTVKQEIVVVVKFAVASINNFDGVFLKIVVPEFRIFLRQHPAAVAIKPEVGRIYRGYVNSHRG